jgi:hypothetical protein
MSHWSDDGLLPLQSRQGEAGKQPFHEGLHCSDCCLPHLEAGLTLWYLKQPSGSRVEDSTADGYTSKQRSAPNNACIRAVFVADALPMSITASLCRALEQQT